MWWCLRLDTSLVCVDVDLSPISKVNLGPTLPASRHGQWCQNVVGHFCSGHFIHAFESTNSLEHFQGHAVSELSGVERGGASPQSSAGPLSPIHASLKHDALRAVRTRGRGSRRSTKGDSRGKLHSVAASGRENLPQQTQCTPSSVTRIEGLLCAVRSSTQPTQRVREPTTWRFVQRRGRLKTGCSLPCC